MALLSNMFARGLGGIIATSNNAGAYIAGAEPKPSDADNSFGSWMERVLDPTKVQMQYNTAERIATEKYNADQAKLQRDWEESMANSAYQRAVKDLEKAGLNPFLAYNQGGAATPVGTAAHMNNSAYITGQSTSQVWQSILSLMVNTALGVARMNESQLLNSLKMDNALAKASASSGGASPSVGPSLERDAWIDKFVVGEKLPKIPKNHIIQIYHAQDPHEDYILWFDKDGKHQTFRPGYDKWRAQQNYNSMMNDDDWWKIK